MKIKELWIGDWVNFCGNRYKVEYVDARGEEPHHRIALRNDDGYHIGPAYSIEPIPITPEILKKNGFELKSDGWLWHEFFGNEYQNYIFIQFRKYCEEVRYCEFKFHHKTSANWNTIQYVHELQHALRLCKIDKEIKL